MATKRHCDLCDATPAADGRRYHPVVLTQRMQVDVDIHRSDGTARLELCEQCLRQALRSIVANL